MSRNAVSNPYSVLGVGNSATQSEIKSRYYELSKQYHPDVNKAPDAAEKFAQISEVIMLLNRSVPAPRYRRGRAGACSAPAQNGAGAWNFIFVLRKMKKIWPPKSK